jgi:outer membrane immunogenic protein
MRTLISGLLALCGLALLPAPSLAEDFAGPHVEATLGWDHNDVHNDGPHGRSDGLLYGGGAGYDLRFGQVVMGVEGELAGTTAKSCFDLNEPAQGGYSIAGRTCNRTGRSIFAGARLGYVVGEHTLLYALGGYANVHRRAVLDGSINGTLSHAVDHVDRDGYRVGAGIEQSVARHAFVRAEYRYTHTGRYAGLNQSQVVTALGWRF